METIVHLPLCKLFPHKLVQYYYSTANRCYSTDQGLNLKKDRKKAYKGFIGKSAQRIIEEKLTVWHMITCAYNLNINPREPFKQKRLVFITLTLSSKQKHTDIWLKDKLLEQFLKDLRYRFGMRHYFWCAEKQKNGNLHFHLVVDFYIPKEVLRAMWNSVQDYHGYLNDFKKQFGRTNAPSTFVEVISSHNKAIKYVMKYVSKGSGELAISGRCWSMSKSLQLLAIPSVFLDSDVDNFLSFIKESVGISYFNEEFFSVLTFGKDVDIWDSKVPMLHYYKEYYETLAKAFFDTVFDDVDLNLIVLYYCDRSAYKAELDLLNTALIDYSKVLPLLGS